MLALQGSISQSIEWLDREGMKLIEQASRPFVMSPWLHLLADCNAHMQADPQRFSQYIVHYNNTICGRHPIGVFLSVRLLTLSSNPCFIARALCLWVACTEASWCLRADASAEQPPRTSSLCML